MAMVEAQKFGSVAFPIIGAGTGGFGQESAMQLMQQALSGVESSARVVLVRYRDQRHAG
jgi:O-acetyl-ADP-ribose deacetylase (regulator of RNase III)